MESLCLVVLQTDQSPTKSFHYPSQYLRMYFQITSRCRPRTFNVILAIIIKNRTNCNPTGIWMASSKSFLIRTSLLLRVPSKNMVDSGLTLQSMRQRSSRWITSPSNTRLTRFLSSRTSILTMSLCIIHSLIRILYSLFQFTESVVLITMLRFPLLK